LPSQTVEVGLGESGYEVLVVEPGLDRTKRLAGELIIACSVTVENDAAYVDL
jgi:hypothetical protein